MSVSEIDWDIGVEHKFTLIKKNNLLVEYYLLYVFLYYDKTTANVLNFSLIDFIKYGGL